jgi:hypothetical protein
VIKAIEEEIKAKSKAKAANGIGAEGRGCGSLL